MKLHDTKDQFEITPSCNKGSLGPAAHTSFSGDCFYIPCTVLSGAASQPWLAGRNQGKGEEHHCQCTGQDAHGQDDRRSTCCQQRPDNRDCHLIIPVQSRCNDYRYKLDILPCSYSWKSDQALGVRLNVLTLASWRQMVIC